MNFTFNLKNPRSEKESLVLFSTYLKLERKKFVYSTGQKILPSEWDFKSRRPKNLVSRKGIYEHNRIVNRELNKIEEFFVQLEQNCKNSNLEITKSLLKEKFDVFFEKTKAKTLTLFDVYDNYLEYKKNDFSDLRNSNSTIKRYEYFKKILRDFEKAYLTSLNFQSINQEFYQKFLEYCIETKKHSTNTLRRNIGLLKSFMNWSVDQRYTYNVKFRSFKTPKGYVTNEVALSKDDIKALYNHDFEDNLRMSKTRDLFVFGCVTGMRFSNYSKVKKEDIIDGFIRVIDKKDNSKTLEIPLNSMSKAILEKYDYNLPSISQQKFNDNIKDVFQALEYNHSVKKLKKIGNNVFEEIVPFYKRISSHTARRTFITVMKNEKVPDKIIMSITGHKSLEVFNKYYKPTNQDKEEFINEVFKL